MSVSRFELLLVQMREAAIEACQFVETSNFEEFSKDRKCQYAVGMCLVVIGSHAAQAMEKCKADVARHREIAWHQIKGMRNRIAHDYTHLDVAVVWDTVKNDLPELIAQIDLALAGV